MANQLFGPYRQALLADTAGYSWGDGGVTIKACAINTAVLSQNDIDNFDTVQDIIDSPSYAVAAVRSNDIGGRSVGTLGEANGNAITFNGLTGSDVYAFAIYREVSGVDDSLNTLIAYIDNSGTLTFSPGGGTTTVQPSSGSWYFRL